MSGDLFAAVVFVRAIVDAIADLGGKEFRSADGESAYNDAGPFVEHEEDIENLGVRGAERYWAVVFHQHDFWKRAILGMVRVESFAEFAGERQTRIQIRNDGDVAAADDDRIREEMLQKRFRAVLGADDREDGFRMAMSHPLRSCFR